MNEDFMNGLTAEIRKRLLPGCHIGINNRWRITITQYNPKRVCHPDIATIYLENGILRTVTRSPWYRNYLIADPKFTLKEFLDNLFFDMNLTVPLEAIMMG